jgi:hypothetical protein
MKLPEERTPAALHRDFWAAPAEALLDRQTVACGLSRSVAWLELAATKGNGPPFVKFGRRVLYLKSAVLVWLEAHSFHAQSTSAYPPSSHKAKAKAVSRASSEAA